MKSVFQNPEIEIVRLHASDIIVTSSVACTNPAPKTEDWELEQDDV